jgi:hypothetical protein
VVEARRAGKIRYLGFSGEMDPLILLRMVDIAAANIFHFDTVQMPLNLIETHFRSFEHQVLPRLIQQGIGVLGIKSVVDPLILESQTVSPDDCWHYALNLPTSTVITEIDSMKKLGQVLEAARTFKPMCKKTFASLLARTEVAAATGRYELFRTGRRDGWAGHNPQRLT